MGEEGGGKKKEEALLKTKKFENWQACDNLYALPVDAVPGCGFFLSYFLKREKFTRASHLYDQWKKQKDDRFAKWLACKFGPWNRLYAKTIINAFNEWEKAHPPIDSHVKGPPHIVGPGSKKWEAFLKKELNKCPTTVVPGIGPTLARQMCSRKIKTAQDLMNYWKTECKKDDKLFHKWILCAFGYWNTLYCRVVINALKAYEGDPFDEGPPRKGGAAKAEPGGDEENANKEESVTPSTNANRETSATLSEENANGNFEDESSDVFPPRRPPSSLPPPARATPSVSSANSATSAARRGVPPPRR